MKKTIDNILTSIVDALNEKAIISISSTISNDETSIKLDIPSDGDYLVFIKFVLTKDKIVHKSGAMSSFLCLRKYNPYDYDDESIIRLPDYYQSDGNEYIFLSNKNKQLYFDGNKSQKSVRFFAVRKCFAIKLSS